MAVEIEEEMDTPKTARLQESLSSKEGQAYPELDLAELAKETLNSAWMRVLQSFWGFRW